MTQDISRFKASKIIKVLYWLCVAAGIWFAFLNINPYSQAVRLVINSSGGSFIKVVSGIPVINGFALIFTTAIHWIIGFILWGIIQTIEIFPMILKRDRAFMKVIISENMSADKFKISKDEDPALIALKSWYNRFPTLTINSARNLALFTYAIDFTICSVVYPPSKEGFGQFLFYLMTGQWMLFDWANISLLMITLFAIEVIIKLLFWFSECIYFLKMAHGNG